LLRVREERRREALVNAIRSFGGDRGGAESPSESARLEGGGSGGSLQLRRPSSQLSGLSSDMMSSTSSSSEMLLLSIGSGGGGGGDSKTKNKKKKKTKQNKSSPPPQSFADVVKAALEGKRRAQKGGQNGVRVHPEMPLTVGVCTSCESS
jgi:hypothetical protein